MILILWTLIVLILAKYISIVTHVSIVNNAQEVFFATWIYISKYFDCFNIWSANAPIYQVIALNWSFYKLLDQSAHMSSSRVRLSILQVFDQSTSTWQMDAILWQNRPK
jgi:hypothetical protein